MNKFLKYGLLAVVIVLLGYNSIYIKKLSDVQAGNKKKFDVQSFTEKLWNEQLPAKLDSAIDITTLKTAIETNADVAFAEHTHALALGNYRYALIKALAKVNAINENDVQVTIQSATPFAAALATEYVYGNAVRDASNLVSLKEFPNTTDLNSISENIDKIIRQQVIPSFKKNLKQGNTIEVTGAIELNKEHIHFDSIEIIPVRVKIIS
jgi:predicted lipoprotein